jgi:glycosyltransferase involved in cell wall biosynthesis
VERSFISIVVPTRNRRDIVLRLLRSLSRQTGVEAQLIVVVEGSTDGTLDALAKCGLPNLNVVHHPEPRGVSAARNAGLDRAEGEYVGFVDDDDFWSPTRAVDAIEAMREDPHGAAWSSCGSAFVDGRLKVAGLQAPPTPATVSSDVYRGNPLPGGGSAIVARTELVRAAGGFCEAFADLADWELWLRLVRESPLAVVDDYQIAYTLDIWLPSHTRAETSIEELGRLRAMYAIGIGANPDVDLRYWDRWLLQSYLRARDRSSMSRLWWHHSLRTRNPLDFGRCLAFRLLSIDLQLNIYSGLQRRSLRGLNRQDIALVERWLSDVTEASPGKPK